MKFTGICLITRNVPNLVAFYKYIFRVEAEGDDVHSIIKNNMLELTIFSLDEMEKMAPNSTQGIGFGNVIIGFEVENIDTEYNRIKALDVKIVMKPTTHPWGSRSFWFADPDGNIIDFFAKQ
jgi:predicted enzyme related to lactoylglutathione lyase